MGTSTENQQQKTTFFEKIPAFTYCLNRSRFSVVVLLIGLGLMLSDQGQDLLVGVNDDGGREFAYALLAATAWAFSIWGWCRLLLDIRFDAPPTYTAGFNFWRRWMPRTLGTLALAVFVLAAFKAVPDDSEFGDYSLAVYGFFVLIGFHIFVTKRRKAQRAVASRLDRFNSELSKTAANKFEISDIGSEDIPPYTSFVQALGVSSTSQLFNPAKWTKPWRTGFAMMLFALFLIMAAWGNLNPVWQGSTFGALVLFFLWGATWLPIGSLMSYAADKRNIPLLSLLVVLAMVFSLWNDNHEIRIAKDGDTFKDRPSISEALDNWASKNELSGDKETPFVVVATAGGGIRAAYWTATVLGDLHERYADFAQRTFAISGVSGGSVGATVYRAFLETPPEQLNASCKDVGIMQCTQNILGHDFLGPNTSAMLYPDLAQRFWPFACFPDRAEALENSWEQAFKEETGVDTMSSNIGKLGADGTAPSLFLNATWADNGRRIVASNLSFGSALPRANDQLEILDRDLRMSTAAHNSARFPMVSPPGMWKDKHGEIAGRLQDGGLFENYGAETALEILNLACDKFSCDGTKPEKGLIKPVVILISSDPTLPEDLAKSSREYEVTSFGYEVRSTFKTYEKVRSGRAAETASRLEQWVKKYNKDEKDNFHHFRMCKTTKASQPPLGWYLSDSAKTTIQSYLLKTKDEKEEPECRKGNEKEACNFIRELGGGTPGRVQCGQAASSK